MRKSAYFTVVTGILLAVGACSESAVGPESPENGASFNLAGGANGAATFVARPDGVQEVPSVATSGTGLATFEPSQSGNRLRYKLFAANLTDVTQAHIHLGASGSNGPVVAFLFGPSDGVSPDGRLASGVLTDDDVIEREGFDGTVASLIERIASGETYVNVHTTANPAGEIRGQIMERPADAKYYLIRLRNRTGSQPLSPGIVATHDDGVSAFREGAAASEGIRLIAENGDPSTAVAELSAMAGVHEVLATPQPVGCQGCGGPFTHTLTMFVEAAYESRLSVAVMAICTNDGFAGLETRLPPGFRAKRRLAMTYDAGTEANDELYASIVDPCGAVGPVAVAADGTNDRTPTTDVVRRHGGIMGVGDLDPAVYGWRDSLMRVVMRRID